ncbi:hypothetical protein E2K80_06805 [Rhodophyticola sp. CCM32]|nr:hypothetical protein E2K80_06805 [Rhodophyticola sp. CCM32]
MAAYDRLPAELRLWVAEATLPWSPRSTLRAWRQALKSCGGDTARAKQVLTRVEQRQIAKDARKTWGYDHPAAQRV